MIYLASIVAAIIPAMLYTMLIYYVDRYEKEPIWLLAATFFWGAVPSIIGAIILSVIFEVPFYLVFGDVGGDIAGAVIIAPLVEESIKGVGLLLILLMWRHHIDSWLDGIIYGAMIGMGFAMVENFFYFIAVYEEGGTEAWQVNIFLRAIVFGLNHSLYTAMMGLGIAIARLSPNWSTRILAPFIGWVVAVLLHALHNGFATAGEFIGALACIPLLANAWGGVFITAVIIGWSLVQEHRWIKKYLQEEVDLGTITTEEYNTAYSSFARFTGRSQALFRKGFRNYRANTHFYLTVSKLAYSKHHYVLLGDEESRRQVDALRAEVYEARQALATG